jgi:hypothetical protein
MKKLHIAIGVDDIEESVKQYSVEFNESPVLIIPGQYALWRTDFLNVSIRKTKPEEIGKLRHLGWEKESVDKFSIKKDCNGIEWEEFDAKLQEKEIKSIWPEIQYNA